MTHIIELSDTYQLGIKDTSYVVYPLEFHRNGEVKRKKATYCKTFDGVLELLIRCEMQNENVTNLQSMQKVLDAIRAEVSDAICRSQSGLY